MTHSSAKNVYLLLLRVGFRAEGLRAGLRGAGLPRAWARSLPATSLSALVLFLLLSCLPASEAGFFPVGMTHLRSSVAIGVPVLRGELVLR